MGCKGSKSTQTAEGQLTEDVKQKVRESWEAFTQDDNFSNNSCLIFVKLFELAPASKELFSFVEEVTEESLQDNEKLHKHAKRVTDAISTVLANLDNADVVSGAVTDLGARHVQYGAKEEYIQPVAMGVLYALERTLQTRFSKQHKQAWLVVLGIVGQLFVAGMKQQQTKE